MKPLFYIIGGVACAGLVIAATYLALTIGLSIYVTRTNEARAQQYDEIRSQVQGFPQTPPPPRSSSN